MRTYRDGRPSPTMRMTGLAIPDSVEGHDLSVYLEGGEDPSGGAAVLMCPHPFGSFTRTHHGGVEFRGIRRPRHTYVRTLSGPWLLYDNETDPFQMDNLVNGPEHRALQDALEAELTRRLKQQNDTFEPGNYYLQKWGYEVNEVGNLPYTN